MERRRRSRNGARRALIAVGEALACVEGLAAQSRRPRALDATNPAVPTDVLDMQRRVLATSAHRRASARPAGDDVDGLSAQRERPMIIGMTTTGRQQRRYDHRLRDLVQRTGDVTIATNLGVPRSTARGWLRNVPNAVVGLDVMNLNAAELQREVIALRQ